MSTLLADLQAKGLLDKTLVVLRTESSATTTSGPSRGSHQVPAGWGWDRGLAACRNTRRLGHPQRQLRGHRTPGVVLNQATSALLSNLQTKRLLDQTLVVLGTEFGRTPRINDNDGQENDNDALVCLLAGAGINGEHHSDNFEGTLRQAAVQDQATSALLPDLRAKGLPEPAGRGTTPHQRRVGSPRRSGRACAVRPPWKVAAEPDAGGPGQRVRADATNQNQRHDRRDLYDGTFACLLAGAGTKVWIPGHPPRQLRGDHTAGGGLGAGDERPVRRPPLTRSSRSTAAR